MNNITHINVVARRTDPDTAHLAAAEFESNQDKAQRSVRVVVKILQAIAPASDFQILDAWPAYWGTKFSDSLPRKARHWAREQGLVRHAGYGTHNGRKVRTWCLGEEAIQGPVECPCCGRKTRSEEVIQKIRSNESGFQKELF